MNDHHLLLGRLVDFITGRTIDDTHDERYRQKIARLLVMEKGYARSEIQTGGSVRVQGRGKSVCVPVTFAIHLNGRQAMLIHYGPGSVLTRHRPALALARLAAPCQIPVVVVTNGESADILDGPTGRVESSGLANIPSKKQLIHALRDCRWEPMTARRAEMEARIVMAYEVDDRCPCDSFACAKEDCSDGEDTCASGELNDPINAKAQMNHQQFMQRALILARQALDKDEFPVGCVVAYDGRIIAGGARIHTCRTVPSEIDHAEILALRRLEKLGARLDRSRMTLYATLEPCLMCFGAILISGIGTLVYAYEDAMGGGTACDCAALPELYRRSGIGIVPGVCREESLGLFKAYFNRPHIAYWRDSLLAHYTLGQAVRPKPGPAMPNADNAV